MKLFDPTLNALEKSLDLRFRRHTVLASNVANSETPNYRAREVDFAGELSKMLSPQSQVLEKTSPRHMDLSAEAGAHVVMDNSMPMGNDGNNVDLDISVGRLAENARGYSSAINMMQMKLRLIKSIVKGGSGGA